MARADIIVLGAGIVGTSIALHLAKRGMSVALIDRAGPGEGTSYGNTGIIEGNTIFPAAFPSNWSDLVRIALKRAPQANYHVSFLPRIAPWLAAFHAASRPARLVETAHVMRPLFARAVSEHEALTADAGAERYLRHLGWLKLYRTDRAFAALASELELAARFGIANVPLDRDATLALEPSLGPVFRHAVHWTGAVSVTNPLALTRAYAARFAALGGITLAATRARSIAPIPFGGSIPPPDRSMPGCRDCAWTVDAGRARSARHQAAARRQARLSPPLPPARAMPRLSRPVLDAENGYCLAPMEQGTRLTTGAEFAARDAAPTPVQFDRLLPAARQLFALGEPVEAQPWMGARPCFADSRPVISRAPRQRGLWLAYGHGHWGLTLGPATGRLVAEMIDGGNAVLRSEALWRGALRRVKRRTRRRRNCLRWCARRWSRGAYCCSPTSLSCCWNHFVVLRQRRHRLPRHHVDDLEAGALSWRSSSGNASAVTCWKSCISTMPLPRFFSLVITDSITFSGLRILKSKESMSVEKVGNVALAEIAQERRRLLEVREAEERRDRRRSGHVHGADAHFDLGLGLLDILGVGIFRQVLVRPGVAADVLPAATTSLVISGCQVACSPISKNVALRQLSASALSTAGVLLGPRAVVEGQHHFVVAQEIVLLEVLEAEGRAARRVDFDDARQAHSAGLVACGNAVGRGGCTRGCGRDSGSRGRVLGDARRADGGRGRDRRFRNLDHRRLAGPCNVAHRRTRRRRSAFRHRRCDARSEAGFPRPV